MTCMNEIIITHRVKLITDDSILTVVTVWGSHSGKSTTGKGEYWDTRRSPWFDKTIIVISPTHYTKQYSVKSIKNITINSITI